MTIWLNNARVSVASACCWTELQGPGENPAILDPMKIRIDSVVYKCWHEVGHATVCLHLGGDVDFIEFLDGNARGYARARCVDAAEIERSVACGGFAAEVYLLKNGYAEQAPDDKRDIDSVLLNNASMDAHAFWGREYSSEGFTETETKEFVNHAFRPDGWGGVIPIFDQYFSGMQELVRELCDARRVDGRQVKEILRVPIRR
jgi:hypothetical protein